MIATTSAIMWSVKTVRFNKEAGIRITRTTHDEVTSSEMGKSRSANAASIRTVATVRDQVHGHLALGCFNSTVGLARRN